MGTTPLHGLRSAVRWTCKRTERRFPADRNSALTTANLEVPGEAKEGLEELMKGFAPSPDLDDDEEDGCAERWQSMKEAITSRAWGMYDETGIFPALYYYRFVLVVVDMVKSGELTDSPSPLTFFWSCAVLRWDTHWLQVRQVELVKDSEFVALIGAFHGHGQNRRCQAKNLRVTPYVKGVGLESLEGCESFFSRGDDPPRLQIPPSASNETPYPLAFLGEYENEDSAGNLVEIPAPHSDTSKYRQLFCDVFWDAETGGVESENLVACDH
ncbi:hypothetical protein B0H14DRAFT_3459022 [Mycena olivaceomarginata]|nr:hypothetical protein B0H14DRAFT_3459022 [Mycena olivaceomarginata]